MGHNIFAIAVVVFVAPLLGAVPKCTADNGHPIAIRHWQGGGITIETMWGLNVGMGIGDDTRKVLPAPLNAELEKLKSNQIMKLSRAPNADKATLAATKENMQIRLLQARKEKPENRNAVFLQRQETSGESGELMVSVVIADNVTVVNFNEMDPDSIKGFLEQGDGKMKQILNAIDIGRYHYIVIANREGLDVETIQMIADELCAEIVFVNAEHKTIGDVKVEAVAHNTALVSSAARRDKAARFVSLGKKPYEMSDELSKLFAAKEVSCKASCETFSKLSIEQMNFKPANGTHTPRWNTEHMMGRELGFFSSIYNAIDPSIPEMNLNPKQMPKDYKFAHEDWTGEEEAKQMQRVQQFTRRFAYLLDGVDLGKRVKGNPFPSLRALLKQMERHYNEHTANVVKKMELDGWPK